MLRDKVENELLQQGNNKKVKRSKEDSDDEFYDRTEKQENKKEPLTYEFLREQIKTLTGEKEVLSAKFANFDNSMENDDEVDELDKFMNQNQESIQQENK